MKLSCVAIVIILALPLSANMYSDILSVEDYELQTKDSLKPVMTSGPDDINQWKSYNQWSCFHSKRVSYECAIYSDTIEIPSLNININNHTYMFDIPIPDKEFIEDCANVLAEWEDLIKSSEEVCIYGAYMPGVDEENYPNDFSIWYLVKIKTENGYWEIQ